MLLFKWEKLQDTYKSTNYAQVMNGIQEVLCKHSNILHQ